ncbi:MAG TPA: alpha/beta fold hydrolase [Acidobacteriota bacterium]
MPTPRLFQVETDKAGRISALHYPASQQQKPETFLLLAHGAGAGQRSDFMVRFAQGLAERGIQVVTFNFPYMESGRRLPDPGDKLESCYRAVVLNVRRQLSPSGPLVIGGKSLGGRIASQLAAKDRGISEQLSGLVFLGYPLHPPGKPQQLRDRHLAGIPVPMLFIQGSRDAFGTPAELEPVLQKVGDQAKLWVVEGGDHSLKVPKKSAMSQEDVYERAMDEICNWLVARC